jgi:hypothetical protein
MENLYVNLLIRLNVNPFKRNLNKRTYGLTN